MDAHPLVHVNAALNAIATLLLVAGYLLIRQRKERAHQIAMSSALVVSVAFLISYLAYHYLVGHVAFTHEGPVKYVYYVILATHIPLAMLVPVLALWAAWLGRRALSTNSVSATGATPADYRAKHRAVVRWAFPIWLYVSVTGVLVYLMLYWWFPPVG